MTRQTSQRCRVHIVWAISSPTKIVCFLDPVVCMSILARSLVLIVVQTGCRVGSIEACSSVFGGRFGCFPVVLLGFGLGFELAPVLTQILELGLTLEGLRLALLPLFLRRLFFWVLLVGI